MFTEGLIDDQVQFYIYYIAPIQIARIYRLTQEITPAGTLIALNMVIGIVGGTLLNSLINSSVPNDIHGAWMRVIALIMLCISLIIIAKKAKVEWDTSRKLQKRSKSESKKSRSNSEEKDS